MYINGCGAISPQNTCGDIFPFPVSNSRTTALACREPDYKLVIPPKVSRRMSRVVKMGVTAALTALKEAELETVDAVLAGTGMGCMAETEKFLCAITEDNENYLNPAPFIHSTHNTISSQIALLLKCTGYNQTFVHGPASFESALIDGMMLAEEGIHENLLIGGIDEMTPNLNRILKRFGLWKRQPIPNLDLMESQNKGTLAGEGASFFLLQQQPNTTTYARLADVAISPQLRHQSDEIAYINDFLEKSKLSPDHLDLCLLGKNGDSRIDSSYKALENRIQQTCPTSAYKHLCGEYATASAFAMWLACHCLKSQQVPDYLAHHDPVGDHINSVLIINRFINNRISLILLCAHQ